MVCFLSREGKVGNKIKDIVGIEGNTWEYIRPMVGFNCANITLGGAGYPINLYHQQFLNFVEGMSTKVTGTISMINGIIDAFSDVAMGVITDRTKSRFGRHRRYFIMGAPIFFIAYIMKWSSFGISGTGNTSALFAYYLLTAFLYSTGFTMMSIPHTAMLPTVAPKYFERTQFKIVEYAFNSIGQSLSFVFMGLMLGGALANLIERWARGSVTDYVYLPRAVIPFFRRIIWNTADLSVLTGCITAAIALLWE